MVAFKSNNLSPYPQIFEHPSFEDEEEEVEHFDPWLFFIFWKGEQETLIPKIYFNHHQHQHINLLPYLSCNSTLSSIKNSLPKRQFHLT